MNSLIKGLERDAAEPFEQAGTRLLRKGTLFAFCLSCLLVSVVFMTLALYDFLLTVTGTKIAALSIGGAYFGIALMSLAFVGTAMRSKPESDEATPVATKVKVLGRETALGKETAEIQSVEPREFARQIDNIVAPILDILMTEAWSESVRRSSQELQSPRN